MNVPDMHDPSEECVPHNLNGWGSEKYWTTDANDPPVAVEVESWRWRTFFVVTLASGVVHKFICERELESREQGCWHYINDEPAASEGA